MSDRERARRHRRRFARRRRVARVRSTVRANIRAMHAYAVPRADGMIKLDAMENPYGLPADVRANLGRGVANVAINRYPDDGGDKVSTPRVADAFALCDDVDLVLGNGSDELIPMLTAVVARPGRRSSRRHRRS